MNTVSGRRIAVLVGIDDYQAGIPPLRNAVRDVQTVAELLREAHGCDTRTLLNAEATADRLRQVLAQLREELSDRDGLIFYFAGHGIAEQLEESTLGPQGYILLHDSRRDEPGSFFAMTELQRGLANLSCRHLLLVLDCCFAGAFRWSQTRSLGVRRAALYKERFERYLRDPSRQVLTSAAHDEKALDVVAGRVIGSRGEEAELSPFAAAFCRALCGEADVGMGGQPGDGVILASELHLYLEQSFQRIEDQLGRQMQKPLLWSLAGHDKGQFTFLVPGRTPALPSALKLNEENNPYRGLSPYDEGHSSLFFGRQAAAEQLQAFVQGHSLTVVVGASGTGKSSLVHAGLLPRLRKQPDSTWVIWKTQRPGTEPLQLISLFQSQLAPGAATLPEALAVWQAQHPRQKLLFFIDQLEEVVTHAARQLDAFVAQLQGLYGAAGNVLHLVLALRSDFEPHFKPLLSPAQGESPRFLVRAMSRAELREAIEGPASERMLCFEPPQLVERLLDEVADTPGALPLQSFVLSEMYRASLLRPLDRTLSEVDYQQLGGVAGALSQRADAIYERCADEDERQTFKNLLLRQVVPGEAARRRVPERELIFRDPAESARVQKIKERLLGERLLASSKDIHGQDFIEPAHDKLIMGWPLLGKFIADDKRHQLHHSLIEAATQWEASGRNSAYLWDRDPQLPQARDLRQQERRRLNQAEAAFVKRSLRRRREKFALAALAVLTLLVINVTWLAVVRRANTNLTRANQTLDKQNQSLAQQRDTIQQQLLDTYVERGRTLLFEGGNPSESLLWLHRAREEGSTNSALPDLIKSAIYAVGAPRAVLLVPKQDLRTATFSPDGRDLVAGAEDGTASLWAADTGGLRQVLTGHQDIVQCVAYSPDGRRVVTGSADGTARVWAAQDGRLLAELKGLVRNVRHVSFSPDNRRILTVSNYPVARVWDSESGHLIAEHNQHQGQILAAAYGPDGRSVVTVDQAHSAHVWEPNNGRMLAMHVGHRSGILCAAYSPDSQFIVTAGYDRTARVWEAQSGRLVTEFTGHQGSIYSVAYSPDGRHVVTGSSDHTAQVWEARGGRLIAQLLGHRGSVISTSYSPDGRRIVTSSNDGTAKLWEADSGSLVTEFRAHRPVDWLAAYSPDGQQIVTTGQGSTARVWAAESGKLVKVIQFTDGSELNTTYSPDRRFLVTTGGDRSARVRDAESGRTLVELQGHTARINQAVFSRDSQRVVTASSDYAARVWEAQSGRLLAQLEGHRGGVWTVDYSPDGLRIVTASTDGTARVWNAASGHLLTTLQGHSRTVWSASHSPDGRHIVTASEDQTARVWEAESGRLVADLKGHHGAVLDAVFSRDGRRVTTVSEDFTARIWEVGSARSLVELTGHKGPVFSVGYSPDGRSLFTLARDNTTRVWDADTGRPVAERSTAKSVAASAAYSPDSRRIVTALSDGTAQIWETATGRLLAILSGHHARLRGAIFSPDGRRIVTTSEDASARVWDVSPDLPASNELRKFMACVLPVRLEPVRKSVVLPNEPAPEHCQGVGLPP